VRIKKKPDALTPGSPIDIKTFSDNDINSFCAENQEKYNVQIRHISLILDNFSGRAFVSIDINGGLIVHDVRVVKGQCGCVSVSFPPSIHGIKDEHLKREICDTVLQAYKSLKGEERQVDELYI